LNTRFLETLVVLTRVGSFRETAEALHVTQTAVSQRIASLEDLIGLELIDRSSRKLALTPQGEYIVTQAKRMLKLEKEMLQYARSDTPPSGKVGIGATETVVKTWLSPLILELNQTLPLIDPEITVDTSANLKDLFRRKKIDVLIQDTPFPEATGTSDFLVRPICDYVVHWVASPKLVPHTQRMSLQELAEYRLLTFSRQSLPRAHLQNLFMDRELEPTICSFPSVESILQLVLDGYGVAAIPGAFGVKELEAGTLVRLAGPALPTINTTAITRRGETAAIRETAKLAVHMAAQLAQRLHERTGQAWMHAARESAD